jgi:hypothetical protein
MPIIWPVLGTELFYAKYRMVFLEIIVIIISHHIPKGIPVM